MLAGNEATKGLLRLDPAKLLADLAAGAEICQPAHRNKLQSPLVSIGPVGLLGPNSMEQDLKKCHPHKAKFTVMSLAKVKTGTWHSPCSQPERSCI